MHPIPAAGRWFRLARVGWYVAVGLSLAVLLASIPGYLSSNALSVFEGTLVFERTPLNITLQNLTYLASYLASAVSVGLAVLLFVKKPDDRMGLFLAYYLLAHGILFAGPIELLTPFWPAAPWVNSFILLPIYTGPLTMALVGLFPDGRFVPNWAWGLIPLSAIILPLSMWGQYNVTPFIPSLPNLAVVGTAIVGTLATLAGATYAQVYRYRRVSSREQRQQTKWVLYGLALWFLVYLGATPTWGLALALPPGTTAPWWLFAGSLAWAVSAFILPLALTIAMTRYRLFDIDILINRTLVYAALTVCVVAIYVLVVGGLGLLFQASGSLVVSLVATGLVAVLFQPLRERLQRGVNRLVYGERDDPLAVLARLARQLEDNVSPEVLLRGMVETIRRRLQLPYVAIEVTQGEGVRRLAASGSAPEEVLRLPLVYQGETLGRLAVATRDPGAAFGPRELALLETIARQAGAAVRAARLTADLQRSRQRLVTAREEERRRLRRDLHDGLGPQLASQALTLDALERRLRQDPASAARLINDLKGQAQTAVQAIRRLVYDLRPPALDQFGLDGAIREAAAAYRRGSVQIRVLNDAESLPRALPAAVEVAAYRIVQEALTNVTRHAAARHCVVRLGLAGSGEDVYLEIEVSDDGRGLPQLPAPGVGLASMRERAEELGGEFIVERRPAGGTRVAARLPAV